MTVDPIPAEAFIGHVERAFNSLDAQLRQLMENVVISVEDRHIDEPDLLGLYEGTPLTEREAYGLMELPDSITIYRLPLCEMCRDIDELISEIQITVVHEIAHHFGIDDDRLHELGWG